MKSADSVQKGNQKGKNSILNDFSSLNHQKKKKKEKIQRFYLEEAWMNNIRFSPKIPDRKKNTFLFLPYEIH